jgi:hypothetical protein
MADNGPEHEQATTPTFAGGLAEVAKRHEEIRSDKTLTLFVPGYEGLMKIQYRLLPEAEMDRLGRRIEEIKRGEGVAGAWKVEADSLVAMCDRIYVREGESDSYQVLEDGSGPIRFEGRFAQALEKAGVKVSGAKATEIVLDFFSPREDPANPASPRLLPNAMERHTNAIFAWNRGEKEKIDRTLLGE